MDRKENRSTTVRKLQEDDLCKQAAMRYIRQPEFLQLEEDSLVALIMHINQRIQDERRPPETISEWITLVLLYPTSQTLLRQREYAIQTQDTAYMQAEQWLRLIDDHRRKADTA